ncbi:tripartite tricarboxylate transporter substrate binding protein [Rhodococcus sp. BP-252]|nr:tripartite tricarboxylate transporter substrate binding protein [Rhodococcus sp. BP-320]MBY6419099.1 tripartite tricarboxylate transporter substrate binding protein [Rhodococcus sp. BP-321]MBY6423810.1 tripartite tricarboxylate transporter substrate binding protein [Rhodococcus sp. BP-324]MBY6429194.1 tripartite tricarboxylate transporter substrate binding protein [Rhodococcus sp. BP-323]MBY6434139.1 tripartite tricarboxylate transporter substrate binding protein [Rhodococcus sp. BP-322]MBY
MRLIAGSGAAAAILIGTFTGCADRSGGGSSDDDFPSGNITLLTPTAAGGATDLTARTLGKQMEADLGVSVIVENRPGGAGSIGMQYLADQDANGYTIGVLPVEVSLLGHQGYSIDPAAYDFLGQVNSQPGTIAVPANSPFQTLDDLLAAAKAEPGSVTVSNAGPGSIWEAGALELGRVADVQFTGVPFDGGAPAVTAAVGSQVDAVVAGIGETAPAHADGRLRVLAVFTEEPAPGLPGVPTAQEQGLDVVIGSWAVIAAPTGLPDSVATRLEEAVESASATDEYIDLIESGGNLPLYRSADETTTFVGTESDRFEQLAAQE